jgi:predicted amino acid-binding ACT domain protein
VILVNHKKFLRKCKKLVQDSNFFDASETINRLRDVFAGLKKELGVNIYIRCEDLFNAMHRI